MSAQLFEVFSGEPQRDPMWIGTEQSREKAEERMAKLAAEKPGKYFVWFASSQKVVAEVDTTHQPTDNAQGMGRDSATE